LTNLHELVHEEQQKVTKMGLFKNCPIWSPINWALLKFLKEPVNLIWRSIGTKLPNLVTLLSVQNVSVYSLLSVHCTDNDNEAQDVVLITTPPPFKIEIY